MLRQFYLGILLISLWIRLKLFGARQEWTEAKAPNNRANCKVRISILTVNPHPPWRETLRAVNHLAVACTFLSTLYSKSHYECCSFPDHVSSVRAGERSLTVAECSLVCKIGRHIEGTAYTRLRVTRNTVREPITLFR